MGGFAFFLFFFGGEKGGGKKCAGFVGYMKQLGNPGKRSPCDHTPCAVEGLNFHGCNIMMTRFRVGLVATSLESPNTLVPRFVRFLWGEFTWRFELYFGFSLVL